MLNQHARVRCDIRWVAQRPQRLDSTSHTVFSKTHGTKQLQGILVNAQALCPVPSQSCRLSSTSTTAAAAAASALPTAVATSSGLRSTAVPSGGEAVLLFQPLPC